MLGGVVGILAALAFIALAIMLTIQRCHDFNASGWWALVGILPVINLVFWFIPGTDGPNRFGKKTPPNGIGVILLACIPLLVVLGMFAAIAIPAYQSFLKRSKGAALYVPHRVAEAHTPAFVSTVS
jgi:hypothetical protein